MKNLCALVAIWLCMFNSYGQLFYQNFQSSTLVASYVNAAPTNSQFTQIAASGTSTVSVAANRLDCTRGSSGIINYVRSVGFSSSPTSLMIRFDVSVSGNNSSRLSQGEFYLGTDNTSAFADNNNTPASNKTYAKIAIGFTSTNGTWFMRDMTNSVSGNNYTGTQTVLWVVNKSGATMNYKAPDGTTESIASDRADVWVGSTREFNDIIIESAAVPAIDKIKFLCQGSAGTISLDNIMYDPIPAIPVSSAATGVSGTSFNANWTPVAGVTGYRLDVATNATFTSLVSGYNNLYVSGQATSSLNITGLISNTAFYYRLRGASQYSIDEYAGGLSLTQSTNTVLPVKLEVFQAIRNNGKSDLNWSTASEINTKSFEIERSSNGKDFVRIGQVSSKGNTVGSSYNFNDYGSLDGNNFYRLRIVDIDGSFTFSPIVQVSSVNGIKIRIYPNPSSQFFTLRYPKNGNICKVSLLTIDGRTIRSCSAPPNTTQLNIAVNDMAPANYFLVFEDGHRKTSTMFTKK